MDFGCDPHRKDSMRSIANSSYTSRSSAVDSDGFMAWQQRSSSEYSSLDMSDREKEKLEREMHELQVMIVNTRRLLKGDALYTAVESLNIGIQEKKQRLREINGHSKDRKKGGGGQNDPGLEKVVGKSERNLSSSGRRATSEGENEPVAGLTRKIRRLSSALTGSITTKMNTNKRRASDESLPEDIEVGGGGTDLRGSAFSYFNEPMPVQRQKAKGRGEGHLRSSAFSFFRRSSADEGSASDEKIEEDDARPAIWVKGGDGAVDIRELRKELYG